MSEKITTSGEAGVLQPQIESFTAIDFESNYLNQLRQDEGIKELDPLRLDGFFAEVLPIVNETANTSILVSQAISSSKFAIAIKNPSQEIALACVRDLGMLAASLTRHGVKVSAIPALHNALSCLSRYSGEVPRDTVFSYGPRNPEGSKLRRFTSQPEEEIFISSFREGMTSLAECINYLDTALGLSISDEKFSEVIDKANDKFKVMITAIQSVRKNVPPEVFTHILRPYFDPYEIDGVKYLAPGGAAMPVILIDKILWADNVGDPVYDYYYEENLSYLPYSYQEFAKSISGQSIYSKAIEEYNANTELSEIQLKSFNSLMEFFNTLVKFRAPHKRVADDNFKLRSSTAVGSGGFKPDLLQMLIDETFNRFRKIRAILPEKGLQIHNFEPFKVGSVFNPLFLPTKPELKRESVKIKYPSRLNGMAIDPGKITTNENMVYTPGEVVFAVDIGKYVRVKALENTNEIRIVGNSRRKPLIEHSATIIKKALGFDHGLEIEVDNTRELRHCGLGSSSGLIASVASAINEMYGVAIPRQDLVRYLAQNHGEEIDSDNSLLMPVQCIGGSAAAGILEGGVMILAGKSSLIAKANIDPSYKVIIGLPKDFTPQDSQVFMELEIQNLSKFLATGEKYGKEIAYDMLHKVLPDLLDGNLKALGDLMFRYRFEMGSIQNCSFVYPNMVNIAQNVRSLKEDGDADVLSLSSVGPAFFAITRNPEKCKDKFEQSGMQCFETSIFNESYNVID